MFVLQRVAAKTGTASFGERDSGEAPTPKAAGVIDPTKVVRFALQNAAFVAGLMLTTEAMIAEKPEKKKESAMPPGGMADDMY